MVVVKKKPLATIVLQPSDLFLVSKKKFPIMFGANVKKKLIIWFIIQTSVVKYET